MSTNLKITIMLIQIFLGCASAESNKINYVIEDFDLVQFDGVVRERCIVKYDGKINYDKGVYLFKNDLVYLVQTGYIEKINFDNDSLRNEILYHLKSHSEKIIKMGSFNYLEINSNFKTEYVGNFPFPIPTETNGNKQINFLRKDVPIYIITE